MTDTETTDPGQMRKMGTDEGWTTYRAYVAATSGDLSGEDIRAVGDRLPDWKRDPWAAIRAEVEREMVARVEALYDDLDPKAIRPRPPFMLGRIHEVQRVLAALKGQGETGEAIPE